MRHALCVALLVALSLGCAYADSTIDTQWGGFGGVSGLGEDWGGYSIGQTFIAPLVDTQLDDFSFWLQYARTDLRDGRVNYAAYLMAWDGQKAAGPVLYTSDMRQVLSTADVYERADFYTGGINLTPGGEYVAFLSGCEFFDGMNRLATVGMNLVDTYLDGSAVGQLNLDSFTILKIAPWTVVADGEDLGFVAHFSGPSQPPTGETPELPASALALVGLVPMALAKLRRSRAA